MPTPYQLEQGRQWKKERAAYLHGKFGERTAALKLSAEAGEKISRSEMKALLIEARKDPILSRALDAAQARTTPALVDLSERMMQEVERFTAFLDFVQARFLDGDESTAEDLWAFLKRHDIKLKAAERSELLDIIARIGVKEAVSTAAIASKEARSWLELDLKARRIIPSAPQVNVLNVQQGQAEMLSKLCACCRANVAGLPKPAACDCNAPIIDVPPKEEAPSGS